MNSCEAYRYVKDFSTLPLNGSPIVLDYASQIDFDVAKSFCINYKMAETRNDTKGHGVTDIIYIIITQ